MGLSLIYFMFLILRKVNLIRRHFAKELVFHNCFNNILTHIKTWCQMWTYRINRWGKAEMISIKIWKNPEHYRPVMSVSYLWLNGNHLYGRRRRWISRSRSELFAISGNRRSPTCLTTFLNPWLKNQWYWFCMYFTFLLRVHSMNWCFTHWLAWMIPLKIRFVHWRVHW